MKRCKKLIMTVLIAALLVCLTAGTALAAGEEYTYTLRFSTGVQGQFDGTAGLTVSNADATVTQDADEIIVSGLLAGDVVSFNAQAGVGLDADSKYYVQGLRLSGRDNNIVAASSIVVDEDADYVVAYGIKGEMTSYTVNYYNEDGEELAASDVFYGNVGEKPVVAYKYIDGYVPQVFGYTKTLSANAAENVFTFVYEEAEGPTIITIPGEDDGENDDQTPGGDDTNVPGEGEGQTPGGTDTPGEGEGQTPGGADTPDDGTPGEGDQIVDLDPDEDEDVPLGNQDLDKAAPLAAGIAIAVVAVIAIIVIILFVRKNLASRV